MVFAFVRFGDCSSRPADYFLGILCGAINIGLCANRHQAHGPPLGPEVVDGGLGGVAQGEARDETVVGRRLELGVEGAAPGGQDPEGAGVDAAGLADRNRVWSMSPASSAAKGMNLLWIRTKPMTGAPKASQLRRAAASRAWRSCRAMPMCAYSRPPTAWEWGSSSAG